MYYSDYELEDIKALIRECLNKLYTIDSFLFERNQKKGISEPGLVFRFAHYLQKKIDDIEEDLYVDCDFNCSYEIFLNQMGKWEAREKSGK
jgi:hypothetical protein